MIDKIKVMELKNNGFSYKDISGIMNAPIGTIKAIVSRTLNKKKVVSLDKEKQYCLYCNKELFSNTNKRKKIFCSSSCRLKYWLNKKDKKICKYCGNEFTPKSKMSQSFCSRECYIKFKKGDKYNG